MMVGKVIGNIVATRKDDTLVGTKLLIVQVHEVTTNKSCRSVVAVDSVGAGPGETVLVVEGSSARRVLGKENGAIDAIIVGIIDTIEIQEILTNV